MMEGGLPRQLLLQEGLPKIHSTGCPSFSLGKLLITSSIDEFHRNTHQVKEAKIVVHH